MRRAFFLMLLVCFPILLGGGARREWVLMGVPFPDQVIAMLDVSASMHLEGPGGHPKCATARVELARICSQMTDGGKLLLARFGDTYEEDPQGWVKLPDKERVDAALKWAGVRCSGMTLMAGALKRVLRHDVSPLGIVVVTDGQSTEWNVLEVVRRANKKREEPAVVGVLAVEPKQGEATARGLAEDGGGAYLRVVGR